MLDKRDRETIERLLEKEIQNQKDYADSYTPRIGSNISPTTRDLLITDKRRVEETVEYLQGLLERYRAINDGLWEEINARLP